MRPDALRPATAKAAAKATAKLATRLSKGEKRNRKRIAEVGAVYDADPGPAHPGRHPARHRRPTRRPPRPAQSPPASGSPPASSTTPRPSSPRSSTKPTAATPTTPRTWIALVDGNNHQIDRIEDRSRRPRACHVTILIDFIHVLEYLWKAAWCFHAEGDPAAETWVAAKARAILAGKARHGRRRDPPPATTRRPGPPHDAPAPTPAPPTCTNKRRLPRLPHRPRNKAGPSPPASSKAPAATSSKTAWTSPAPAGDSHGAEAILKLRALRSNGDFDDYWTYHLTQEQHRVHQTRYANNVIPRAA